MYILTIRTDSPEAEIGLFNDHEKMAYKLWRADRTLSDTILRTITDLLSEHELTLKDIRGVVGYQGPGSFTGLRIGLTVANTVAFGNSLPIIGSDGDGWIETGIARLLKGDTDTQIIPSYGAEPHITQPKK